MFHANSSQKRVAVVKDTSDKIDFRPKSIRKNRRIVYVNKRINFQEDMTSIIIPNITNKKSPKYVKLILTDLREKSVFYNITWRVQCPIFNKCFFTDRKRQKIRKEIVLLSNNINQLDLTDIHKSLIQQ